ncbi:MAG: tRNA (guanine(26)-N(2))-dimethyltransferase [Methanomassiliicoccales archaeon]
MSQPADSILSREGATDIYIPVNHTDHGPGKIQGRVFYNRQMAFNRDVSVMFFSSPQVTVRTAIDAMSATGVRALRIAKEARPDIHFDICDRDSVAAEFIKENIILNGLENCTAVNNDLRCQLAQEYYDYVDLDPFGTPVEFIPAALQALKRNGILAITATDTAPLAGAQTKKCIRRYGAMPCRGEFCHEAGLRILIGYVAKEAAKLDKGTVPMLCFYADHYMRLYLRMPQSAYHAEAALDHLGFLHFDRVTHERTVSKEDTGKDSGPMWLGPLADKDFLRSMKMVGSLEEKDRCAKYMELWTEELDIPYFFENNELSSVAKLSPPRREVLMERMKQLGAASRTHFSPTGFKSDRSFAELLAAYREIGIP